MSSTCWWNRTTLALIGAALLIGGFIGGMQVQERWGVTTSVVPTSVSSGTSGTVKLVDGSTFYLQTADGGTVTVKTSDATTVKVAQPAALSSLTAGQQVTVQGSADAEGVVTAILVNAG
ncbi:DUF5666 domain-containing protein [Actinoplanes sp. NBC_00393]|uniref:hypothetical protein n=1 Tax=Actinoplanes sp. NBC_00393 TaxID=2975953 RepID=UPI002E22E8C7